MANKRVISRYHRRLVIKLLVIVVPSFGITFITDNMMYTLPMLASATFLASHMYEDEHPTPDATSGQDRQADDNVEDMEFYDG